MKKNVVIGILAHVDAGKTTLSEAMLYLSGKIKKLGRVDHRDSYLDTHSIERSRGITIFSKQAVIDLPQSSVTLLDTPGHVDFVSETERSLRVLDYAVLVISGTDGVQAHTETLWQLLRRYGIPTFIFVTKMDLPVCDRAALMADLQRRLNAECVDFGENAAARNGAGSAMVRRGRDGRISELRRAEPGHDRGAYKEQACVPVLLRLRAAHRWRRKVHGGCRRVRNTGRGRRRVLGAGI